MVKTRILLASALALVASATSAKGPIFIPKRSPNVARISYADVNLHSAAGASVVRHRILVAAESVCSTETRTDPVPVPRVDHESPCFRMAVSSGLAQLDTIASN